MREIKNHKIMNFTFFGTHYHILHHIGHQAQWCQSTLLIKFTYDFIEMPYYFDVCYIGMMLSWIEDISKIIILIILIIIIIQVLAPYDPILHHIEHQVQ